jgi:hypothetical protein
VLRFRAALGQAVADLERWAERQPTLEGRLLLQAHKEALLDDAWSRKACALIDETGAPAAAAARGAVAAIAAVLARSADLQEQKVHLEVAGAWLAARLAADAPAPDAVVACETAGVLDLLALDGRPALIADPAEPVVVGEGPVVWGVPGLGPHWSGRRVSIDGTRVELDTPTPRWWTLEGDHQLNGHPLCILNGDPAAISRTARKLGRPPVALVRRLEDLAAVPLYIVDTAGVALDLDKLGPAARLKHPGIQLLLKAAVQAAQQAERPIVVGGEPAYKHPDAWFTLGFTALFGRSPHRDALRGNAQRSL